MQPIVIQGTPVTQQQAFGASTGVNVEYGGGGGGGSGGDRESRKETKCNDPFFALLFYVALIAIGAVAVLYAPAALKSASENDGADNSNNNASGSDLNYEGFIYVTVLTVAMSFVLAGVGMTVLMCIPQFIIKAALIFTVILSLLFVLFSFATGNLFGGIIGLLLFALTCCYAYFAWSRIPFATANLVTACTAIKANLGITFFAYVFAILGGIWSVIWTLAFVGVYQQTLGCPAADAAAAQNEAGGKCSPNYFFVFLLFLSFYFVQQVLQNSIHVQVAGTVANWWYIPNENGCCSKAVCNSFLRTVTTSFGSICFGSFIVAVIQALRQLAHQARQNDDCAIVACVFECLLSCLADMVEYFNKWAFVYVGVYGMPFIKAGKSVFELFRNRGWEAIVADDLVGNALFLVSLVVGLIMGGVAIGIASAFDLGDVEGVKWIAFFLGFVIGLLVTSILMSTIGSGVNAVIVLFAEGPREFEENHPELSRKMRDVWSQVYPGSV